MAADLYGRIHEACMAAAHAMLTLPAGDYQGRIDDIVNDCIADLREELEEDTTSAWSASPPT